MTQDHTIRLKRLKFQSWHRGCKETDLILGQFADEHMPGLAPDDLDRFEALLDESDADIWNWIVEKTSPQDDRYDRVLSMLRHYKPLE